MCTVTFLPFKDRVLITSNRDEQKLRAPAAMPEAVEFATGKILFPKDGQAGGTWVALHQNGNAMVLLNGAFVRHAHRPPYRKSRGIIFLDIFDHTDPASAFDAIDLDNIEPFTIVIWQQGQLWEAKWDGKDKYILPKSADKPRIWSSVTLYDTEVIEKRKQWFYEWLSENKQPTAEDVRQFHEFGGEGDERIDLRMNRDGKLLTVSITGIELTPKKGIMHYKDLVTDLSSVNDWPIPS